MASSPSSSYRTRGNSLTLHRGSFRLNIRKHFLRNFVRKIGEAWHTMLPREAEESPTLEVLKN